MIKYDSELYYHTVDRTLHHQVFLRREFCKHIPAEDIDKVRKMCCGKPHMQKVPNDEIAQFIHDSDFEFLVELTWDDACAILILNYTDEFLVTLKLRYGFDDRCI